MYEPVAAVPARWMNELGSSPEPEMPSQLWNGIAPWPAATIAFRMSVAPVSVKPPKNTSWGGFVAASSDLKTAFGSLPGLNASRVAVPPREVNACWNASAMSRPSPASSITSARRAPRAAEVEASTGRRDGQRHLQADLPWAGRQPGSMAERSPCSNDGDHRDRNPDAAKGEPAASRGRRMGGGPRRPRLDRDDLVDS